MRLSSRAGGNRNKCDCCAQDYSCFFCVLCLTAVLLKRRIQTVAGCIRGYVVCRIRQDKESVMKRLHWLVAVVCALFVFVSLVNVVWAAPGLPITKPPVLGLYKTGPNPDPASTNGQWFFNPNGQIEEYRTHEFYDNVQGDGGGIMSFNSISGYVSRVESDLSGAITNFEITATIFNDTDTRLGFWIGGSNSHFEVNNNFENDYVGILKDVKLTAEFAVIGDSAAPALPVPWIPPYYDSSNSVYIASVNEDQWAWYCWNQAEQEAGAMGGTGDYHVPTWDFGDIPVGESRTRVLQFVVPGGLPPTDPRHEVIMGSSLEKNDILLNRTTSLKISTWIDVLAYDIGVPYPHLGGSDPKRSSDVSVFFDREELDFGDAPYDGITNKYETLFAQNGARHAIIPGIMLGLDIDAEDDGQPSIGAFLDDVTGSSTDDEDGVILFGSLHPGLIAKVDIFASVDGYLNAWMDFSTDGSWAEAEDYIIQEQAVTAGVNRLSFMVSTNAAASSNAYARFRFATAKGVTTTTGYASDGEVEDYMWIFADAGEAWDFGDAPDVYSTTAAAGGPSHRIFGPWLGGANGKPDPDVDGQPHSSALGDDYDGHDDERGVWIATGTKLITGVPTSYTVDVGGGGGTFQMWIDWDYNGVFDHPAEMVENTFLSDGHHSLSVTAPAYAVPANTFARCRISSGGGLSPIGAALDGEVEDHSLTVDDGYVDWGRLQYPTNVTINAYIGTMSEDIYGRCWHDGLTPPSTNAAPGLVAQVGYGPDGSDTPWDSNWNWFNTSFNSQTMEPNNDEYVGVVTIPSAGTYDYAFRYSLNSIDWTYADADGSNNGYTNTQAGDIVVTALPKISITNITTVITSDLATVWWSAEDRVIYQMQFVTNLSTNSPLPWSQDCREHPASTTTAG